MIRYESSSAQVQAQIKHCLRVGRAPIGRGTTNLDAEFQDALARFLIGHIDWEHAPGEAISGDR
jgi:hypothetical protein